MLGLDLEWVFPRLAKFVDVGSVVCLLQCSHCLCSFFNGHSSVWNRLHRLLGAQSKGMSRSQRRRANAKDPKKRFVALWKEIHHKRTADLTKLHHVAEKSSRLRLIESTVKKEMASAAMRGMLPAGRQQQACTHDAMLLLRPTTLQRLAHSSSAIGVHFASVCQSCCASPIHGVMVVCTPRTKDTKAQEAAQLPVPSRQHQYCRECWKQRQAVRHRPISAAECVALPPLPWLAQFQAGCPTCFLCCHLRVLPAHGKKQRPHHRSFVNGTSSSDEFPCPFVLDSISPNITLSSKLKVNHNRPES